MGRENGLGYKICFENVDLALDDNISRDALYYINKYGRSSKGCYIRVGTSCRSMTEEQIEKAYTSYLTFPETKMKDVSVLRKDYDFTKLKNYLLSKGVSYNEDTFLENFNLITVDGKYNLIADLLADENMTSIKIAVFKGKDKSKFVKRNKYGMNFQKILLL